MSNEELEEYIEDVFQYYRSFGYPYYHLTQEEREHEIESALQYDTSNIIRNGVVHQNMMGLSLCWSYFPHSIQVKSYSDESPLEVFNDDESLKKIIRKRIKYGSNMSDAALRKAIRMYGNTGVSNFRPSAACAIYNRYAGNGRVWDMSGGYGGRLLGAAMSKKVSNYIATEPDSRTNAGLLEFAGDIQNHDGSIGIEIYEIGSENFLPDERSLDLCFTSPPYFNRERYSEEETQSYIKFPSYNEWIKGFWANTLRNCWHGLKTHGKLVVNIANTVATPTFVEDTLYLVGYIGFRRLETLQLQLSGRPHYDESGSFKYEPILVMEKIG